MACTGTDKREKARCAVDERALLVEREREERDLRVRRRIESSRCVADAPWPVECRKRRSFPILPIGSNLERVCRGRERTAAPQKVEESKKRPTLIIRSERNIGEVH